MSHAPTTDGTRFLQGVIDDLRWNYHAAHPDHDPVYVGNVPAWRFSGLLAASDDIDADVYHENGATGDHQALAVSEHPADVAARFEERAPRDVAPHVTAVWDGDTLTYNTKPSWRLETDDVAGFTYNTELWRVRGEMAADASTVAEARDRYLVAPGDHSLVDHTTIDPDAAGETVSAMLSGLDGVTGRIPETIYNRKDGQAEYQGWADGADAARYWEQYLADDLHVLGAGAAVEETAEEVRYGIRVEGVPEHRYTGQDEGCVTRFWSTEQHTDTQRSHMRDLLDR